MAAKVHPESPVLYEEFEPFCKWQRTEDKDILEINLKDFKKEQLRVQISNHGILKISGERELHNSSTKSKFHKEIPVPSNTYDNQAIHAKFVAGWLCITMPKLISPVPKPSIGNTSASSHEPSKTLDQTPKPELMSKDESSKVAPPPPPPKEQIMGSGAGKAQTGFEFGGRKRTPAKVAVSLAATAAAMAVLIAYVVYMFRSTVVGFEP